MLRIPMHGGVAPGVQRCTKSLACLAFVLALGAAVWAGVLWIGVILAAMAQGL